MNLTSQTTFLYFENLQGARKFFDEVLCLQVVYDPRWACVWRTGANSFLGAVDSTRGAMEVIPREKGGVLVSLTVRDIEQVYNELKAAYQFEELSPIRFNPDIGLKSFIFTGPEGYKFEIQEFTTYELCNLF